MANNKKKQNNASDDTQELETAYRDLTGAEQKSPKEKKSNRAIIIVSICVAIVAIVIALGAGYLYIRNVEMNGIILDNVTVAGIDVGGMTQYEAIDAVQAGIGAYATTPMSVTVLESTAELPTSCVGTLDVRRAVRQAYKFGNTGTKSKRQEQQQIAMTTGYVVDIIPYLQLDEDAIRNALAELGANYSSTLSQSTYEVTGTAPSQILVVKIGTPEYGLDLNNLYEQVLDAYRNKVFFVEGSCSIIEPDPVDLQAIFDKHYVAPVDACFDPETFDVIAGTDGYGFNVEDAKANLEEAAYGTTVEIPFTAIAPTVTAETLSAMLYRDELATYTTKASSKTGRDANMKLACETINGMILLPGEVFSYNEALGERTPEKGYKAAPSYAGGKTVMTYGGGICQVSSTLYYCTLVAELETLARTNHGFATGYIPLGTDATVSWGSLDFRFRNSLNYPIRIEASATGGSVTIRILGTDENDYYVELESEVVSKNNYSITYVTMAPNNPEGYKDGDYIVTPYTGYSAKAYRCKYNNETKELISRELIDLSVYKKRDAVICKIEDPAAPTEGATQPST